ncbi:hypothetical protein HID58_062912 [Brassica napus]|uniref:RING-type domain-containing protein n=2 Tax=Brassica TaxID=3705 RepID=A0ABQ8A2S0_BRANA|nr:PREDICTED: uncharacterized protein LOC106341764 [Brassica oleracea var. oleracea]XP_013747299.1 uncharacterized protein LOC106450191 isoform X1 [Brassica napus]KAH0886816.1 hypothetical protein HID58_062912 [Brassica napus]
MAASSQVEIASLRSNFGCLLRDNNRRNNNDDVIVKKNLNAQVKSPVISDKNSQNRVGSWKGNKPRKKNKSRLGSPEKQRNHFSDRTKPLKRGASSLVQIWEARLSPSNGGNSPIHGQETERSVGASVREETNLSAPSIDGESESENESRDHDPTVEIESETLHSVPDSGESKWGRVAEIIRRLKLTAGDNVGAVAKTYLPEKSIFPVVSSPRLRGRQAFSDLLARLERDRHLELDSLLERNAVSKFPQRGRLQSMLRLRSLKRGLVIQDRHRSSAKSPDLNRLEHGPTVLHLRERFGANATSSTERSSLPNRKTEEAMLCKKETESNLSCLHMQEIILPEALSRNSDNNSPSTSVTHRESQIMENMVESGTQGSQETPFLEKQETSYIWEEEEECENEQSCYGEMSYDWFTEISRPRTYWEDLRQSRYLQVMNSRSDKDDICRLLERRTVSDFLQSGLREKIDKFIMSRVQTHPIQRIHQAGKEEQNCDVSEEEDDLSQTSSQLFASSPAGSWSSQDTGVTSTPDLLPLHNLQTNEMEIISEMRSQILHLQLEMSELRDSVKTCLDVNASLQKSIHRENPLKRKCCVCNETQVDTLLYRCGHMCTCLRCANELQCNGGKCPICYAKILDVVRVFVDSRT